MWEYKSKGMQSLKEFLYSIKNAQTKQKLIFIYRAISGLDNIFLYYNPKCKNIDLQLIRSNA